MGRSHSVYLTMNVSTYVVSIAGNVYQSQWGQCGEEKNSLPLPRIEPQILGWTLHEPAYFHRKFPASNDTAISVYKSDCSVHLIIVHNLKNERHAVVLIHLKLLSLPLVIKEAQATKRMQSTKILICSLNLFLNNQPDALMIQIYSVIKLYMFQVSSLPIIRSFLLYIQHW
jgi:hypothetical protein